MEHCDEDTLALIALGEPCPDPEAEAHLAECQRCQQQVASLADVVRIGRLDEVHLQQPPDEVWAAIQTSTRQPDQPSQIGKPAAAAQETTVKRSGRRWTLVVAAAVVGALAGGVVVQQVTSRSDAGTVVASADLSRLPNSPPTDTATGRAVLSQTSTGYVVELSTSGLPKPAGFYEVWLMNPDDSGLISLGSLSADEQRATFSVPPGLPLRTFNNIDISDEPIDGNPTHSAVSVLRGQLSS